MDRVAGVVLRVRGRRRVKTVGAGGYKAGCVMRVVTWPRGWTCLVPSAQQDSCTGWMSGAWCQRTVLSGWLVLLGAVERAGAGAVQLSPRLAGLGLCAARYVGVLSNRCRELSRECIWAVAVVSLARVQDCRHHQSVGTHARSGRGTAHQGHGEGQMRPGALMQGTS